MLLSESLRELEILVVPKLDIYLRIQNLAGSNPSKQNGHSGTFVVHNSMTSSNIEKILQQSITNINSTAIGFDEFTVPIANIPQTSWFGGRLNPGDSSTTTFTIENPTNKTLTIGIIPQKLTLIEKFTLDGTTETHLQDPILNSTEIYRPNYIPLANFTSNAHTEYNSTSIPEFPEIPRY